MSLDLFHGILFLVRILERHHDTATLQCLLHWIRECCIKHELNRQKIFDTNIFEKLKKILVREDVDAHEIKDACSVIRALVLDDDIRHEYGKAHEHATIMAKGALDVLTELLTSKLYFQIALQLIRIIFDMIILLH